MHHRSRANAPTRRLALAAGATLVLALPLVGCSPLDGGPSKAQAPTTTPIPLALTFDSHLTSIVMRSPWDGWIAGYQFAQADTRPLLLHYHNGAWQPAAPPSVNFYPQALAMVSDTESWMAGGLTDAHDTTGVMLHGVNGQWTPVQLPAGTGKIVALSMVSADEGWAVASSTATRNARILYYAQGAWRVQYTAPDNSDLYSISMDSARDGWAAGASAGPHGGLWHYSGGTWTRVPLNDPLGSDLERVAMVSATEGWGAGVLPLPYQPGDQAPSTGMVIWRYHDSQWRIVKRDTSDRFIHLTALGVDATGDVWVSKLSTTDNGFWHSASGQWQIVKEPLWDGINAIIMTSPNAGWAVGDSGHIMRYANGSWSNYPTGVTPN